MSDALRISQHRVEPAQFISSPHCGERPADRQPELIVIHCISLPAGCFGEPYITDLFLGRLDCSAHPDFASLVDLQVSAHCLIRRNGEIIQYVPFDRRAWHAGVSEWQGQKNCNDFSIGIELEGTDTIPYTDRQYEVLAELVDLLRDTYPMITEQAVTGHQHIAPGRKTDPGPAFDWPRLCELCTPVLHPLHLQSINVKD